MSISTYLSEQELSLHCGSEQLEQLRRDAELYTGRRWFVSVHPCKGGWFRKPYKLYSLMLHVSGIEWQVINFWLPHDWSINTLVRPELVFAYLHGVVSGKTMSA